MLTKMHGTHLSSWQKTGAHKIPTVLYEFGPIQVWGGRPYIRSTCSKTPRTIEQLSADQVRISAEMLNEMVAIYNRYYVMLHEQVVYDPRDGSGAQLVDVIPPQPDREVR